MSTVADMRARIETRLLKAPRGKPVWTPSGIVWEGREDDSNWCYVHNTKKIDKYRHAGTSRCYWDGYYCPRCEAMEKAAEQKYLEENAYWLKIEESAENLEREICRAQPYDGFKETRGWYDTNKWYANRLKRYLHA